jgi:hypothetical protein
MQRLHERLARAMVTRSPGSATHLEGSTDLSEPVAWTISRAQLKAGHGTDQRQATALQHRRDVHAHGEGNQ